MCLRELGLSAEEEEQQRKGVRRKYELENMTSILELENTISILIRHGAME